MGFLGFKKKDNVLDLTAKYEKQQARKAEQQTPQESTPAPVSPFGFFDSTSQNSIPSTSNSGYTDLQDGDKKKKLAKRLLDLTNKIEDLNNQIYRLQQRLEVLERKSGVGY